MKHFLLLTTCLFFNQGHSIDYEVQYENDQVHVAKVKILPHEEIGFHRDAMPQVVVALHGGTITRLEANGATTEVNFPTGEAVFRPIDPPNELHRSVNQSDEPIEMIIIQLKPCAS